MTIKNLLFIVAFLSQSLFAGTGTLTDRATGQTITQDFFNEIHSALKSDFVGRNSSGVATAGQSLGTSTYPWGTLYLNGQALGYVGTDANPTWSVTTDVDTGLKLPGGNVAEIISQGTSRLFVSPTQVAVQNAQLRVDSGTAGAPSYGWSSQTDMGPFRSAANTMAISVEGTAMSYFTSAGFGVEKSYVGAALKNYVKNTDNSNGASHAQVEIRNGGSGGGDPFVLFAVDGIQNWAIGADNSDSDAFVVSSNTQPGTTNYLRISTAGQVTLQASGTSEQLAFHTATEAAGAATATLTNAPAGAAGNPDTWLKVSANGTTVVIPAWTP